MILLFKGLGVKANIQTEAAWHRILGLFESRVVMHVFGKKSPFRKDFKDTVSIAVAPWSGYTSPRAVDTSDATSPGMPAPFIVLTDKNSNFEGNLMCVCPPRPAVPSMTADATTALREDVARRAPGTAAAPASASASLPPLSTLSMKPRAGRKSMTTAQLPTSLTSRPM